MLRGTFFAAVGLALCVSTLAAEDGIPSRSKLSRLGLSSLQVAPDQQGEQIRGQGFGFFFFNFAPTGIVTPVPPATTLPQLSGGFTFGTEPLPSTSPQFRQGLLSTTTYTLDNNGFIDPSGPTVNDPIEFSVTTPTGPTTSIISTFKISGSIFFHGN